MGDMTSPDQTAVTVSALRPGREVAGVFACTRKDRLTTRSGSPYLALELRDRTGTIAARAFRDADALAGQFERGELVRVAGRVERFRDELVLEVVAIERAAARLTRRPSYRGRTATWTSSTDFWSTCAARSTTGATGRCSIGCLAIRSCGRRGGGRRAPGLGITPTWAGCSSTRWLWPRLLTSCVSCTRGLNPDLLLSAAVVHDLGLTRSFTFGAEIGLSDEGRLLGHLVIGERLLSARSDGLGEERTLALLHCVLCHHGPSVAPGGRFGSAEAAALYRLNALDASVKGALEHGLGGGATGG